MNVPSNSSTPDLQGSKSQLWLAVQHQADVWRKTPTMEKFAQELPRNTGDLSTGIGGLTQQMFAAGASPHPMRMGSNLPQMQSVIPFFQPVQSEELANWRSWLQLAIQIEEGHRATIAWLRSRLPGYPFLPAPPQLQPNTTLTTDEYSWRLAWRRADRQQGLQYKSTPDPQIVQRLGVTTRKGLDDAALEVATALLSTSEVELLAQAVAGLDSGGRDELQRARQDLATRLSAEAVDSHEPQFAMPRDHYRSAMVEDVLGSLNGSAAEYARAFDRTDRLIEVACSDVFGQLAAYGTPRSVDVAPEVELESGERRVARIRRSGFEYIELGAIVWTNQPILPDAVQIIGVSMSQMGLHDVPRNELTTIILEDTSSVWARS